MLLWLSPLLAIPTELQKDETVVDLPLPNILSPELKPRWMSRA